MSISLGGVTYKFVLYLRTPGIGFLVEQAASDGSNRGRSGIFVPQNITAGKNGTFIASTEVATAKSEDGLAVLPLSGNSGGFQNGTGYVSMFGSGVQSSPLSGTFTVTDTMDNRGTVTATSGNIAGSGSAAFYVETDTEIIEVGTDATNMEPQIILLTNTLPQT
jgi:hypothetical protein